MIDKTAIVDPGAKVDSNVEIGPFSIIKKDTYIGAGTVIGSHVVIEPYTKIGKDCTIFQYASIGAIPQDLKFSGEKTSVEIGRGTTIREFVTIHRGTEEGGGITRVGEENLLMAYTHIAHDCITGKRVVLSNNATLGGHIIIGDHAAVGGLVGIHQFVRIGEHAFIGGKSAVVKDVPPYMMASGDRASLHGLNIVGLQRQNIPKDSILALKRAYRLIFRIGLTLNEAIQRVNAEVEMVPEVKKLIEFIKSSKRGLTR